MTQTLPPATTIDNKRDLQHLVESLQSQERIACDTESNSLHVYRGRTCLIQLSTPDQDILIDPLAIDDIGVLSEVFANPDIEKVLHAAEYDLICLKQDFDFDVYPVFDTMAAARVCAYTRIGLSHMLGDLLGIRHNKSHQTADWAKRPMPNSQQLYAQRDTHYLLQLRDTLHQELLQTGRLEEAHEYFADVTSFALKSQEFDPEGFWDLSRANTLTSRQMAILRELYILRDELAQMYDFPSQRLISNKALLAIATASPRQRKQLFDIAGLPAWLVRKSGDEIIEAVAHGCESLPPHMPPRDKPIPQPIVDRYTALHNWRKQIAVRRGVESDVIISRNALWAIARCQPTSVEELNAIPGVGPWRRKTYGSDLVAVVNEQGR